jgi:hypothetical protein
MRWIKHGLIFPIAGRAAWMASHAQVPTILLLGDRLRVYFATRPRPDLSLPAFVDLARDDPARILGVGERTVLDVGRPGTFDCDGVMPSSVIRDGERILFYYSGWCKLGGAVPYNNATGVAQSIDGGITCERLFDGPILDRTADEAWSATSPAVISTPAGWYMWYSSGTAWIQVDGKLEHIYVIMRATSSDGIHWARDARPVLPAVLEAEAQTRPTVIFLDDRWHMWFSYRGTAGFRTSGDTYRIGYAWSYDLEEWHRDDANAGIAPSASGWDAQMIAYPNVADVGDRVIMLYNGNDFGAAGFGLATLER